MTTTKTKHRRIRITRNEIDKAREALGDQQPVKRTKASEPKKPKGFWQDGLYCDPFGWAWGLAENLDSVCLGRTEEVIKGQNHFPRGKDSDSGHSKLKNASTSTSGRPRKSIVASFKNSPQFLRLLVHLINSGLGIRAIRSKLKTKGYHVPLRTLGRWVKQQKQHEEEKNDL